MGFQFLIISLTWLAVELQAIPVIHHNKLDVLSNISEVPNNHSILPVIPKTASPSVHSEGPSFGSVTPEFAQAFPTELLGKDSAIGKTRLEQVQRIDHPRKDSVIPEAIIPERIPSVPLHRSLPPSDRPERPLIRPVIPESPVKQVQPIEHSGKYSVIPASLPAWIIPEINFTLPIIREFLPPSDSPGNPSIRVAIPESTLANVQPAQLLEDSLMQLRPQEHPGKRTMMIPGIRRPPPSEVQSSEVSRNPSVLLANSKRPSTPVPSLQVPGNPSILPTASKSSIPQILLVKLPEYFQYYQELHTINQYNFYR